jgi:hypothetical protein
MKTCAVCGREMEMRKSWKKNWENVKYCSDKCRRSKDGRSFEKEIIDLLLARGRNKTICPSEVLKEDEKDHKKTMELVRQSARRLVSQGKIEITQNGQVVDPSTAKGPIRLRLKDPIGC